jgi:DNA-binding transcriptional LysR family regulator
MYEWAEFRHFKYLLTILESRGFRPAAERLFTAQSNLSSHAKQFQDAASVRLYDKLKDGRIRPTHTGVAFTFIARDVLKTRMEAIEALIAIERGDITAVRFGCSPLVDHALFHDFCKMHKEFLPNCEIRPERSDTTQLIEDVVTGVIDAAIVTLPIENAALRVEELKRDRLVVCLRKDHPLAAKGPSPAASQETLRILCSYLFKHRANSSRDNECIPIPGDLMREYYEQRTSEGSLIIGEATNISLTICG